MKLKKYFHQLVLSLFILPVIIPCKAGPLYNSGQHAHILYSDTAYHIDAGFADYGFGFSPGVEIVRQKYGALVKIKKKPVGNLHDNKIRDTIITATGAGIEFNFYKSANGTGLMNASFNSVKVQLVNNIHVGMTKKQLLQLFTTMPQAASIANVIRIGNEEQTSFFEFVFNKGILKVIHFYNTAD